MRLQVGSLLGFLSFYYNEGFEVGDTVHTHRFEY